MRPRSSLASITWVTAIAALCVLALPGPENVLSTVRPIRLDDGPPQANALVTDNPFGVEPYLLSVSIGPNGGSQNEELALELIADLCGDGDGCVLRLLASTDPSAVPERVLAVTLVTDPTGIGWGRFDPGEETAVSEGSLLDEVDESIFGFDIPVLRFCFFQETPSDNYRFGGTSADPDNGITCTLRIED